jgi:hypothetical protein
MGNKVSKKKDILTASVLSNYIPEEKYPVQVLDLTVELSNNNSKLAKLEKKEIEQITNMMFEIVRKNCQKIPLEFGTLSYEIENGYLQGEHLFSIRFLIVAKDFKLIHYPIKNELNNLILDKFGGDGWVKLTSKDKTSLMIEIIPLNLYYDDFLNFRARTLKDKMFYSDQLIELLNRNFIILSGEDLKDPLFKIDL